MTGYLVRRLVQTLPMLWGIVTLMFVLVHLAPGGPVVALSGDFSTAEYQRQIEALYGLDRPLVERYLVYIANLLQGDLGQSYYFKEPVLTVILKRLPATLLLVLPSVFFSTLLGVWFGSISAGSPGSAHRLGLATAVLASYAIPIFWLAQLLVMVFANYLGWFPIQGMRDIRAGHEGVRLWLDIAHHAALPVLAMTLHQIALTTLLTRARIGVELRQPYIRTALAKGLSPRAAVFRHALRNALLPVITVVGGRIGFVFSGAVLTETVFAWPGLGRLVVSASLNRDYPLLLGIFLCVGAMTMIANLVTDFVCSAIDPRIRQGSPSHA